MLPTNLAPSRLTPSAQDHYLQNSCKLFSIILKSVFGSGDSRHVVKRILLVFAVVALYAAHQDFWNWRTAYPLVFGFLPIGLFYHGCFSVAASLVMWLLVKYAWPAHLESEVEQREAGEDVAN